MVPIITLRDRHYLLLTNEETGSREGKRLPVGIHRVNGRARAGTEVPQCHSPRSLPSATLLLNLNEPGRHLSPPNSRAGHLNLFRIAFILKQLDETAIFSKVYLYLLP